MSLTRGRGLVPQLDRCRLVATKITVRKRTTVTVIESAV